MPRNRKKGKPVPIGTILDVLDDFFGSQSYPVGKQLNNSQIHQLREHVIEFYHGYKAGPRREFETRLFLGAFLSSPFLSVELAPYVSSALLCADSLVIFDPLHYWLCDEQYRRPRLLGAPRGWKNPQTGIPELALTKEFLSQALRWLSGMRPLVEEGVVLLTPAEQITIEQYETITGFASNIVDQLNPMPRLAEDFGPDEITVDDNRKGLFAFAGGNREKQISKYLTEGLAHFARDVVLANATNALYCAPFRWEQYLGKSALDRFFESAYQAKITEAIRNLRLPILSQLSPDVLVRIHRDSGYAEFRRGLTDALRSIQAEIGSPNFADEVGRVERDILIPKIETIYREISSEPFQRFTKARQEGVFGFAQTFITSFVTSWDFETSLLRGTVGGSLGFLRRMFMKTSQSKDSRIWTQLIPDNPTLSMYGSPLTLKRREGPRWDIDERPSMTIKVSAGIWKSFS